MKKFRTFLCGALALVVALVAWIQIGSIDQETFNDRGLLAELKPVPDAENGFLDIAYFAKEGSKSSIENQRAAIIKLAGNDDWSPDAADKVLQENEKLLADIEKSNKKPFFSFPYDSEDPFRFVDYSDLKMANELLIIKSRQQEKMGNFSAAIDALRQSFLFSGHVMHNKLLISWLMGLNMEAETIAWAHELSTRSSLSLAQIQEVSAVLSTIPSYKNDGFTASIASELMYMRDVLQLYKKKSIFEKIDINQDGDISGNEMALRLYSLRPSSAYNRPNAYLSDYAASIVESGNEFAAMCNAVVREDSADVVEEEFHSVDYYFFKRCAFHSYVEAVKAAVAVKAYQVEHAGELPATLGDLVPKYLEVLPVDYFGGQPLHYSREKQWFYSLGANYKDDGGSLDGFYRGRCDEDKPCFNNPTVPLIFQKDR